MCFSMALIFIFQQQRLLIPVTCLLVIAFILTKFASLNKNRKIATGKCNELYPQNTPIITIAITITITITTVFGLPPTGMLSDS